MPRTHDGYQVPEYSPDATGADWIKQGWDFPPYKSPKFFEAIGGIERWDEFRDSPAYKGAVKSGLIHDDEWVLEWCTPVMPGEEPEHDASDPHEPGKPRSGRVRVHIHRGT